MAHVKLHIPGPVEVSEKTFRAFCSPMIGHRGQGFKDLLAKIQPQLQALLSTKQLVYLSTSSAWGVMEGAIRNLVSKKVLNCMCGAFSDKWFDVSQRCGKPAERLQVEWGLPIRPEAVDAKLATGQFDALTLIHNETSTGFMSPLAEIAALKQKYPDVLFIVDCVSSLSATKIEFDALGVDVLLAGTQKEHVDAEGVKLDFRRRQRTHAVHDEQDIGIFLLERGDLGERTHEAGGSLVMDEGEGVELAGREFRVHGLGPDGQAPLDLEPLGRLAAALGDVEPFVREGAAHAVEHFFGDEIADGAFHHAPRRAGAQ